MPKWLDLHAAQLHVRLGDLPGTLRIVRAGRWIYPAAFWSAHLREEARLAALTDDRDGAVRAFRHYLALRSDPERVARRSRTRPR